MEDLTVGEEVLLLDGDYGTVTSVILIEDDNQPIYNLTVEEVHTFAVGEGDWVVLDKSINILRIDIQLSSVGLFQFSPILAREPNFMEFSQRTPNFMKQNISREFEATRFSR